MKNKILKNSFIYVFGDVLNKAVPFFMLPILTRYLTPSDYGIISVFTLFVSIIAIFTGLTIHGAINVNFFKMKKETLKIFIGNCLIILNISTFVVLILVYLCHPFLVEKIHIELEWLLTGVVLAFAQFLTTINLLLWTAEQQAKPYSIYQISQTLMITLLSITFVVGFGMDWEGQLLATTIGTIIFSIVSFIFMFKRGYVIFQPNKEYIKDALYFGVPLIPHTLSGWIKTGADRIIIMSLLGVSATGIYAVGYQVGMIISVLVSAINKAWTPYLYNVLSNKPTICQKIKIVKFTYLYFVSILIIAALFNYMSSLFLPYFLGDKFLKSSKFIIYFSLAFSFQGMYFMIVNYIFYVKKTYILAYVTFGTAVFHLCLLYLLINKNGVIGAAQTTLISFITTFIVVWILANRVYKMPWNIFKKEFDNVKC